MSLNCIVDPAVPHMEPFVENKMPYMYVNNVKEHSDPVILLRSVIGMMRFMIKHCSSNNIDNFGENIKKYMNEINNSLRIYNNIKKNHDAMEKGLSDMRKSLVDNLEEMKNDEKKSRDEEYHPTPKKFKANNGNGHKNDSIEWNFDESPENNRASTSTPYPVLQDIRASNNLASTEPGKIPIIQL